MTTYIIIKDFQEVEQTFFNGFLFNGRTHQPTFSLYSSTIFRSLRSAEEAFKDIQKFNFIYEWKLEIKELSIK